MSDAEVPWRGLHPLSVVVNLLPRTIAFVRTTWPLLAAFFLGRARGFATFDLLVLLLFFSRTVGATLVHFATLRYRVSAGRLELKTGLLRRQVRLIAAERIQNIELVRNVLHRVTGLVEVRIETASGTEVEGLLSALSRDEADALMTALNEARGRARPVEGAEEPEQVLVENEPGDLVWYGVTGARLGATAVLYGVLFRFVSAESPEETERLGRLAWALAPLLAVSIVSGALVLSVGTAFLRFYGYRLLERGGTLVAEHGLFTRRRIEISMRKVQLVDVVQPALRRAVGLSSVLIETAAAREGGDGTSRAEAIVPVLDEQGVDELLQRLLPVAGLRSGALPLIPPAAKALRRAQIGAAMRGLVLTAFAVLFFGKWGGLAIVLVPLGLVTAALDYRAQGWLLTPDVLIAREGFWTRHLRVLARGRVQSADVVQGLLLRRWGLARLAVRVAGSVVVLPAMSWDDALALQAELMRGVRTAAVPVRPAVPAPVELEAAPGAA